MQPRIACNLVSALLAGERCQSRELNQCLPYPAWLLCSLSQWIKKRGNHSPQSFVKGLNPHTRKVFTAHASPSERTAFNRYLFSIGYLKQLPIQHASCCCSCSKHLTFSTVEEASSPTLGQWLLLGSRALELGLQLSALQYLCPCAVPGFYLVMLHSAHLIHSPTKSH